MSHIFDSAPRAIMAITNILFAITAYLADYNETHVFNPRWPPHAKFHNGQNMSFGALAAATAVYLLGRRSPTPEVARDSLFTAAVVGSLTTVAGLSAIFYSGTDWADPEFHTGAAIGPQAYVFVGQLLINWGAYLWEKGRLERRVKTA